MSGTASKYFRWSIALVLVLVCMLAAFWPSRTERILLLAPLSETKGEQGTRRLREQLAACGPDAIAPILKTIQRHNLWDRDWLKQLPLALHDLGEPAHRALLENLDARPHSLERTRLMAALQLGFSDYSRFELWLTNAMGGGPAWCAGQFAEEIGHNFPDAPRMRGSRTASGFNPRFLEWWGTNSQSKP